MTPPRPGCCSPTRAVRRSRTASTLDLTTRIARRGGGAAVRRARPAGARPGRCSSARRSPSTPTATALVDRRGAGAVHAPGRRDAPRAALRRLRAGPRRRLLRRRRPARRSSAVADGRRGRPRRGPAAPRRARTPAARSRARADATLSPRGGWCSPTRPAAAAAGVGFDPQPGRRRCRRCWPGRRRRSGVKVAPGIDYDAAARRRRGRGRLPARRREGGDALARAAAHRVTRARATLLPPVRPARARPAAAAPGCRRTGAVPARARRRGDPGAPGRRAGRAWWTAGCWTRRSPTSARTRRCRRRSGGGTRCSRCCRSR